MLPDSAARQQRRVDLRRRRRRRRVAWVVVIAAGIAAVVVALIPDTRPAAPKPFPSDALAQPTPPPGIYNVGPAPNLPTARDAEFAAVTRLAKYGLPLYCGGQQKRMVALTFDDGPGVYTHYAIQYLEQAHLHATFFLVGKEIRAFPGLAPKEKPVAVFGDHTMTHPFLPALPYAQAIEEITAARRLIERTVREPVLLFRPPYEGHTKAIDAEVTRLGMQEVLWDVDSADSLGGNYLDIERRVIAGLQPGSIVLMHENHGQTIRALHTIFAAIRARHLQPVTIPQLIADDPPSLTQLKRGYDGCPIRATGTGS